MLTVMLLTDNSQCWILEQLSTATLAVVLIITPRHAICGNSSYFTPASLISYSQALVGLP
jgi:hypothetical protein